MPAERKLVVRDGDRVREVLLVGTVTVGRSPTCDISSADPRLSRTHATFDVVGAEVIVRDLESSNGTVVNGERITEHRLVAGDTVEVGPFVMHLLEAVHVPAPIAKSAAGDNEATVMQARRSLQPGAPDAAHAAAPRRDFSPPADASAEATHFQRAPSATGSGSRTHQPRHSSGPSATSRSAPQTHRPEPDTAIRRGPAGELTFARATLLLVVPLALVSFLAGLVPDLMRSDQREPLLRAHHNALAAGTADLVRTSGDVARPIDTVTTTLRRHTGVVSVRIVGADGRVVAPLNEAGTRVVMPPMEGSTPRFAETETGLVDVHVPAVMADGQAVVVALVVDPEVLYPAPTASPAGPLLLLVCLGAAWLAARRLTAMADSRLSRLGEELELMTTGQVSTGLDPFSLRGGQRILDAVTFALSPAGRRQSDDPVEAPRFEDEGVTYGSSTATIEADAGFRIVKADAACEALLGLVPAAARGMHLIDALGDQAVVDEVLRLVAIATPEKAAQGEASPGDRGFRLGIDVKRRSGDAPLIIRFTRL